jgi:rod shape determining protein RodA
MAPQADKGRRSASVLRNIDWWTIFIYFALLSFGWISVCGAS